MKRPDGKAVTLAGAMEYIAEDSGVHAYTLAIGNADAVETDLLHWQFAWHPEDFNSGWTFNAGEAIRLVTKCTRI
jgi:hypothetical protein